ncbi:ATP-dependent dethiobiotin synthetase BioD [Empedobacter brevis NBRC 14943 = ATCC 43319]|uniref:ATP-dependent dethiobiotin synthetase BioD n=1 Tax=Empedobacter brevis NBRC 14943 = ATCC 43319 TaxID=1218108 RepID=A0A511NGM8_9FLAO|nr:dethiobiotin synthase [Empedobacter brevis]GEM51963.1 ATP-dependent dethiobiotin synthetase BioD [Empedobacter brevis NBRC 14943 = ATCC 43319]
MNKKLFVTGIGTGIGKTIVSAILTEALQADYWKPVQSGDLDRSDSELVKSLTSENIIIHQERYQLQLAASPHQSAKKENIEIKLTDFSLPVTSNHLIVEGAGGLFVPLNEKEFMLDVIQHLNLPVVAVSTNYLGCINHTLLSIEALKNRGILIDLFVFNGEFDEDTHQIILKHLPEDIEKIYLPKIDLLTKENLQKIAVTIRKKYI